MSQEETIEILQELLKSVKHKGFKKTLNLLKTQTKENIEITNEYDKFVLSEVSKAFGMQEDGLLNSKYLRGDNKYAIGLCVHYLYEKKSLGEIQKTVFVKKNKTLLSKYRQIILELNPAYTEEKNILIVKSELDKKIANFKK